MASLRDIAGLVEVIIVSLGVLVGFGFAFWRARVADSQAHTAAKLERLTRRQQASDLQAAAVLDLYSPHLGVRLAAIVRLIQGVRDFSSFDFRLYEIFLARIQELKGDVMDRPPADIRLMIGYLSDIDDDEDMDDVDSDDIE